MQLLGVHVNFKPELSLQIHILDPENAHAALVGGIPIVFSLHLGFFLVLVEFASFIPC